MRQRFTWLGTRRVWADPTARTDANNGEEVKTMANKDMRARLKQRLREAPLDTPAVEAVQPEIRTAAQYLLPSMRTGLRLDEPVE